MRLTLGVFLLTSIGVGRRCGDGRYLKVAPALGIWKGEDANAATKSKPLVHRARSSMEAASQ
jgi:hypothetical protein